MVVILPKISMKQLFFASLLLIIAGCSSPDKINKLEERIYINKLEERIYELESKVIFLDYKLKSSGIGRITDLIESIRVLVT